MSANQRNERAVQILARLQTVRESVAAESESKRRQAVARALHDELAQIAPSEQETALSALRDSLADEARRALVAVTTAQRETERTQGELLQLQRELDATKQQLRESQIQIEATRASLNESQEQLMRTRQQLAAELQKPAVVPARVNLSASAGSAPRSSDHDLRHCLQRLVQGTEDTVAVGQLDPVDRQVYHLVSEVLNFSLGLAQSIVEFKMRLMGGNTVNIKDTKRRVQTLIAESLSEKEGALAQLKKQLEDVKEFPISIADGYLAAIPVGAQLLLDELDPAGIVKKHTGGFMKDYERATKEITGRYVIVSNLPAAELVARYFDEPIRDEIRKRLK